MGMKSYLVGLIVVLIGISFYYNDNTQSFLGLAEANETLLSNPHATHVQNILVTPGQKIQMGDTLALLSRPELELEIARLQRELDEFTGKSQLTSSDITSQILNIEKQLSNTRNQIKVEIQTLSNQLKQNLLIQKSLNGESFVLDSSQGIPLQIKNLKQQLQIEEQSAKRQVQILKGSGGKLQGTENQIKQSILEELERLKKERTQFALLAPHAGMVNAVLAHANQNLPAYSPVMSLSALTPTTIRGYIPEVIHNTLSLEDSVKIYSLSNPNQLIKGEVIGMGSRIVEIPLALKKFPEDLSYGREVLISIPSNNSLLLSEKVRIYRKFFQ